jgi:hypothetical protein
MALPRFAAAAASLEAALRDGGLARLRARPAPR